MTTSESIRPKIGDFLLGAASFTLFWIERILVFGALLFLMAKLMTVSRGVHQHAAIQRILGWVAAVERPPLTLIKRWLPTDYHGRDLSGWILVLCAYLLSIAAGKAASTARWLRKSPEFGRPSRPETSVSRITAGMDRSKLLEIYTKAKKTLEAHKRDLAFLSIDVVDSTGMKTHEDPRVVERDFRKYREMVERIFDAHDALTSAWTPDGVMSCFADVPSALETARDVIQGLRDFNRDTKAIRADFAVRIGVNAGPVLYDQSTSMEQMSDQVIDIAGHLQKHGKQGAICISKQAVEPFLARFPFKPADRVVDGHAVYEWEPAPEDRQFDSSSNN